MEVLPVWALARGSLRVGVRPPSSSEQQEMLLPALQR